MTDLANAHQGLLVSGRFPELEDALCERVGELQRGRPLAPVTVVVGSSAVRARISDVLVRRLGAVANVSIVTLARVAADTVAAHRGAPPVVLTGPARERLVRRVVVANEAQLSYFGPVARRPHFAAALAATFADLREAHVSPESDWARHVGGRAAGADLNHLYTDYCTQLDALAVFDRAGLQVAAAALQTGGSVGDGTPDDDATRAGHVARSDGIARSGHTILYGIYDLNEAQALLVASLLGSGADIFVPAAGDALRDEVSALGVAFSVGLSERRLEAPAAVRDLDLLAALGEGLRGSGPAAELPLGGDGSLQVVSVPDQRAEAREAVRVVVAALESGVPLWDCAVVVPSGDMETMATAFRQANLGVTARLPARSAGVRLLLRLADCLCPAVGEPFARRAVIDLFAAGDVRGLGHECDAVALWLDEARQAGVVAGMEPWTVRMRARCHGLEQALQSLEGGREDAESDEGDDRLGQTRHRLRAARGLRTAVDALADACDDLPERATWSSWGDALATVVGKVFAGAAAEGARDAAARLQALGVLGEEVDRAEAVAMLRELLLSATAPAGRLGRAGVALLTPFDLRGLRFHTVLFTDLAEGGLPVRGRADPILGDAARRRISEAFDVRLPLAEQRDAESARLFGFACQAARERLVLLAPRTDAASGRPRLPSRFLLRLASLAAGHSVRLQDFLDGRPLTPVWRRVSGTPAFADDLVWTDEREYDTAALLELSRAGRRAATKTYLARALGSSTEAARRLGAWRSARSPQPGPWDGLLGAPAKEALILRQPLAGELHPTRLERYVSCPFTFLLHDVLGLQAPQESADSLEIGAQELGSLAHAILERTYCRVSEEGLGKDAALAALDDAWVDCCRRAERRGVTGAALAWEVRRELLREDLAESVRRDPVFISGDGRPAAVEWRFGEKHGRPVALDLDQGRQVRFAGRLDRVDVVATGARVIDYKTGSGEAEKARVREGLSVQLPVYQLAVRQAVTELLGAVSASPAAPDSPAGRGPATASEPSTVVSLYRLVTRRGGFRDIPLDVGEEESLRRLRALVAGALTLIEAGLFPRTTRGSCDYCDVAYACGVSQWARSRKREHADVAPVVRLQGPAPKGASSGD